MGIFGSIRDAIFGRTETGAAAPAPATPTAAAEQGGGWMPTPGWSPPATPVDVDAVLREKLAAKGNPELNYQSSIVDLMKLLDLDSSLAARGQLAEELGYTGAKDGSAEMNIWLHRKVMEGLEQHGGRVPENMKS
jgi:hypothetical protein